MSREQARKKLRLGSESKPTTSVGGEHEPEPMVVAQYAESETGNFRNWGVDGVADFLKSKVKQIDESVIKLFYAEKITGQVLLDLQDEHLEKMGIRALGDRLSILQAIRDLHVNDDHIIQSTKVFNDPIHGHIEVHPLLVKVIDTPQFQRLRFLKQLGACYFVYPGGSHNRFEHSIGVSHLAGEFVKTLQKKQPELNITECDVLAVQVAGLCHDLGHGPFSHLFDGKFIKIVRPDIKWAHEDCSVKMFNHLVDVNNLKPEFKKYGLGEKDLIFITEMIQQPKRRTEEMGWPFQGRDKSKAFLYEIVANKRNGIDVDKWDYFARDCHHLGIKNSFDHCRYMRFMRVLKVDDVYQICARDKEVGNLYEMFHTRNILHQRAYQHKGKMVVDVMITEALVKANKHFSVRGKGGEPVMMSNAIDDMEAYTNLTDHVFQTILYSTDEKFEESRKTLNDIMTRKLYKCIGHTSPAADSEQILSKDDVKRKEIAGAASEKLLGGKQLKPEDFVVLVPSFDYGMKGKNPVDAVRFYKKEEPDQAFQLRKEQVSKMLPDTFSEQTIRVYSKLRDHESIRKAVISFKEWCKAKSMPDSQPGTVGEEFTPIKSSVPENLPHTQRTPKSNRLSLLFD